MQGLRASSARGEGTGSRPHCRAGRTLGRVETQEGIGPPVMGNTRPGGNGPSPGCKPLESTGDRFGGTWQRHEGKGSVKSRPPRTEGESPEGTNPMGVCGMKQAHRAREGASRQEGEKPWSRKVAGVGSPRGPDLSGTHASKGTEPHEGSLWLRPLAGPNGPSLKGSGSLGAAGVWTSPFLRRGSGRETSWSRPSGPRTWRAGPNQ